MNKQQRQLMCKYFGHEVMSDSWTLKMDWGNWKLFFESTCERCKEAVRKTDRHTELEKKKWAG